MPKQTPANKIVQSTEDDPKIQTTNSNGSENIENNSIYTLAVMKDQHKNIITMLDDYNTGTDSKKIETLEKIVRSWLLHSDFEEEVIGPAAKGSGVWDEATENIGVERDLAKIVILDLEHNLDAEAQAPKVRVLFNLIRKIMEQEEQSKIGLFEKMQATELGSIGQQLFTRQQEQARSSRLPKPRLRHLSLAQEGGGPDKEEYPMNRQSNMRDRDDRGRFTSDDDRGGRSSSGRDRDDDDDRRFSSSRRRDDDDERRSSRDDDDRGRGWFGDSEGHSQAARRNIDERRSSRYRDDEDDDRRSSSSRRRDDDDDRRSSSRDDDDRGRGWFGDSEGHSEAARRGARSRDDDDDRRTSRRRDDDEDRRSFSSRRRDDDDDRRSSSSRDDDRGRGWFGDPEGHSEAARRGGRSRDDDDDRRSFSSRRRDDDDDRRSYSSRSRDDDDDGRGWHGDPRGHAEAARRGWQSRRG